MNNKSIADLDEVIKAYDCDIPTGDLISISFLNAQNDAVASAEANAEDNVYTAENPLSIDDESSSGATFEMSFDIGSSGD